MSISLNDSKIDAHDAQFKAMLENLQGNILKGHGREHTIHLFLEFGSDIAANKANLKAIANKVVTSAILQRDQTDLFNTTGVSGGPFGNVFLTATGYAKLGLSTTDIKNAFPENPGPFGELSSFKDGMKAHGTELDDPAPSTWEPGYQNGTIDAMILLADDDPTALLSLSASVSADTTAFSKILNVEHGDALRGSNGEGLEHFGYVDGRSQPIYFSTDLAKEGKTDQWDPSEPLGRVLVQDKTTNVTDSFGSYFVFRKLEQNVQSFRKREEELADFLGLAGSDRPRAGAMVVGRFRDGTPLSLSNVTGFAPPQENNFNYAIDKGGLKCPFHAHIRTTNPRGDIIRLLAPGGSEEALERSRRITRRGIPYGKPASAPAPGVDPPLASQPTSGVGLLFMCFQASISSQFAFMQRSWANKKDFVVKDAGPDPVVGQVAGTQDHWHPDYDKSTPEMKFSFGQFITLKGGEFFFAPSIPFLKSL